MTTQQTALNYGVPMPETCQELDWKGITHYYWYKNYHNEYCCITNESEDKYDLAELFNFIPAPNIQELFEVLPNSIYQGFFELIIDKLLELVYYDKEFMYVEIQNNNLADALAKLYILLRENDLLTKN
jgi:hypothetical protein